MSRPISKISLKSIVEATSGDLSWHIVRSSWSLMVVRNAPMDLALEEIETRFNHVVSHRG